MPGDIGSGGIVEIHIPPGGTAGQVLAKIDGVDYNATWGNGGAGGGIGSISVSNSNVQGAQVYFSNSPTISFGANGNTITASGAAGGGGAAISAAGSSVNNGTVVFSNANNVSFSMNGSTITATASFNQSAQPVAFSASGGSSAFSTLSFSNANGVSFSNNAGQVLITHDLQFTNATSNITSNALNTSVSRVAAINGSSGTMSFAVGSSLSASSNASTITFGLASNITTALQSAGAYLTTAAQSNQVVNSLNGSTGQLSLNVGSSLSASSNASNITFGLASNITTALQSAGAYLTTAAQSSVSNVSAISAATNNTGGGTATLSGGVSFSNANNLTFYTSAGNAIVASFSTSQSVQTQASGNLARTGVTTGATAGSQLAATLDTGGLSLGVPAWLTAAAGGGDGYNIVSILSSTSGGGTLGATFSALSASIGLMAGSNITLSQTSNTINIIGPTPGAGVAIAASNSTFTNGSVWLTVTGGNMTIDTAGAQSIRFSVASQSVQAQTLTVSAANTSYTVPSLSFSNANNVSFSLSNNSQVYATATFAQSVQTQASGDIARSGFTTGASVGSLLVGTLNSGGLSLSVPPWITTAAQSSASNVSLAVAATNNTGGGTASLSGAVSFTNANGLTFYTSAGNAIAASYTVPAVPSSYVSNVNASSGAISLAVGSSLSASSNASTITFGLASNITTALQSAGAYLTTAAQSSASNVSAISAATNNTGGGTATLSGGVSFSNANNLTFYTSAGNAIVASFSTSQSVQTQASGDIARSGFTTNATAGSVLVGTLNSAGLNLGVPAWLTAAAGGGGAAVSIPAGGNSTSAGAGYSNISSGTAFIIGGPNITLSQNGASISISANNPGAAAENNWVNLLGANTAGNTTVSGSTLGFSGVNMTLSGTNNSQLVMSVPATSSLVGVNGISVSTGGSTISIINQPFTGSWWQPEVYGATTPLTMANGTVYIRPFELDGYFDVMKINMFQSFNSSRSTASFSASVSNASSSSGSGSWGLTGTVLIFSRIQTNPAAASFNSLISMYSNTYTLSAGYSASCSWNANVSSATNSITTAYSIGFPGTIGSDGAVTYGNTGTTGTTSFSSTSTNQNSFSSSYQLTQVYSHFSGLRAVYMPAGNTLGTTALPPAEYWLGVIQSTTWGSTNMPTLGSCASMSDAGRLHFTASTNNFLEIGNSVAFTTSGIRPMFGSANVSSGTTGNLALNTFSSLSSYASMWFALDGRKYP
jgi:hypothetical protein